MHSRKTPHTHRHGVGHAAQVGHLTVQLGLLVADAHHLLGQDLDALHVALGRSGLDLPNALGLLPLQRQNFTLNVAHIAPDLPLGGAKLRARVGLLEQAGQGRHSAALGNAVIEPALRDEGDRHQAQKWVAFVSNEIPMLEPHVKVAHAGVWRVLRGSVSEHLFQAGCTVASLSGSLWRSRPTLQVSTQHWIDTFLYVWTVTMARKQHIIIWYIIHI